MAKHETAKPATVCSYTSISNVMGRKELEDLGLVNANGERKYFYVRGGKDELGDVLTYIACTMADKCVSSEGMGIQELLKRAYVSGFIDGAVNFGFVQASYEIRGKAGDSGLLVRWQPVFIQQHDHDKEDNQHESAGSTQV